MKLSNGDQNTILREISKTSTKKVISRPMLTEFEKNLYQSALKKFIKSIGFYCLTEDLVFFRKNESIFYVLSLIPEVSLNMPKDFSYDNFQISKNLEPHHLQVVKKVVDIKMSYLQEVLDGPISKKVEINFQLSGYEYNTIKKYKDYAEFNMLVSLEESPKMIESLLYEQLFNHFKIEHNLKTDFLSKNLGVILPELFKNWNGSSFSDSDHVFIDPAFSKAETVSNLVKLINDSK